MGFLMNPVNRKDFWADNRFWNNNPMYSAKTQKELNARFDKIVQNKLKPESKIK